MSITGQQLRINGLDFNVLVEGDGPKCCSSTGSPTPTRSGAIRSAALVEAGYRVIAPDLRGFGQTAAPPNTIDYGIDRLVSDVIGVLDALDVRTVRLVGHDWGSAICWHTVIRHPDRIARYAALSVGHPNAYEHGGIMQQLKSVLHPLLPAPGALRARGHRGRLVAVASDDALRRRDADLEGRPLAPRTADRRAELLPREPRSDPPQAMAQGHRAGEGDLGRGRRGDRRAPDGRVLTARRRAVAVRARAGRHALVPARSS